MSINDIILNNILDSHNQHLFSMTMTKEQESKKEIISSGGMHSLLNVFKSCSDSKEDADLKRAAALAVAHLIPSSHERLMAHNVSFDLKLMDCLKFLVMQSNSNEYEQDREVAAIALTHRWINTWSVELQPTGSTRNLSSRSTSQPFPKCCVDSISGTRLMLRKVSRRKDLPLMETLEAQEVVEKAVSLVIVIARSLVHHNRVTSAAKRKFQISQAPEMISSIPLAVESICAIEAIRPILAREGLVDVLVEWLQHGGLSLERSASNSLKSLLSSPQDDQYLAGWIHSQIMVNHSAIPCIIRLSRSDRPEVRFAAANILGALSSAPHISEKIIAAGGPNALVCLLQSIAGGDPQLGHEAASALLKLVAGSIMATRARGWVQQDNFAPKSNLIQ